ncbi:MAG: cysteine synthase A [Lachnospiraceae bacterium]|nr:cysteine synthase A [Lachnospiraceae bacterium]
MSKIYQNISELVGNTPLLHVANIEKNLNLNATVLVKLEYLNPAGSIKDRAALSMINDAERRGILHKGSVIIEPTSGNTGIGLAAIAASKGYKVILTMPETMSVERRKILSNYGAKIILTPGSEGMSGAIKKANEIASSTPGSFLAGQFINPANPAAHFNTTGPEIWNDTDGLVDIFIAGVGTGGTITGIGEYLKSKRSSIQVIAVEPASSPVLSGGTAGKHGLQGIGAGFIPNILNTSIYDEIYKATEEEAVSTAKMLAAIEGISVGITSGASLSAAINYAKRPANSGKTIVALLPDSGDRYYSTALFD